MEVGHWTLTAGGHISTTTAANTNAGIVKIEAAEVHIAGEFQDDQSGLFSVSNGGEGQGGSIVLDVGTLTVRDHGVISTSTEGEGAGGNINITARRVEISDETIISAKSVSNAKDAGNAGMISVRANDTFLVRSGSTIETSAPHAGGGDIQIVMGPDMSVQLVDSKIIAAAGGEEFVDTGGDIRIQSSDIVLISADSELISTSEKNVDGEIDIRTPISELRGVVTPLLLTFHQVDSLLRHQCAKRQQEQKGGSFVLRGRDRVPIEPHDILPSSVLQGGKAVSRTAQYRRAQQGATASYGRVVGANTAGQARMWLASGLLQGTVDHQCAKWQ